jgi:tRNA A-37 threonylcarbamoyl transferase component Bud32
VTTPNATTSSFSRRCRHCGQALDPASSFCSKCGATAELPGAKGDPLRESLQALFGRELEIQDELGRGGMAAVYAAFDPALQRRVAVKMLLPEMTEEPGMEGKFLQEARTVASLQHPHVVTVYGVRANETTQAIVMQFVEGRSLDTVIKGRTSRLPIPVAALILSQAASGLQHAHDRGIIHRDVKPANVLLDHDGRAIVSDFGIARRDTAPRTTATGFVIGTWSYMSPEQRQAQSVSGATDQYAFGVMAFEILTGELPFTGTVMEVLAKHLDEPVPSLRELRPEIPVAIEALVHRMMAKQPSDRFPSMRDAERAFKGLVPDEGGTTQIIAQYSHVQQAAQPAAGSAVFAPPKVQGLVSSSLASSREAETVRTEAGAAGASAPASRSNTRVAIAAGAVLLVIAGVAWQLTHRAPQPVANGAPAAQTTTQPANSGPGAPAPRTDSISSTSRGSAQVAPSKRGASEAGLARGTTSASPAEPAANSQLTAPVRSPPIAPPATPSRADSTPARPVTAPAPSPSADAPPAVAATVVDARKIGKDFATMLNRRQYRELAQVPAIGGDAAQRAELIRLTQNATDFAAGFDRIASAPERTRDGFSTDFVLDLEWQGGHKLMLVTAFAAMQGGSWRLAGFGVETPR